MRLVNPDEILERYNWYVDVMENEPDSALSKALNEATDYNDQPGVKIAMTMEQWQTVQRWLQYGIDYHMAKKAEVLANCKDHHMAAKLVAGHETAAAQAETVWKIIEASFMEDSTNETTES